MKPGCEDATLARMTVLKVESNNAQGSPNDGLIGSKTEHGDHAPIPYQ